MFYLRRASRAVIETQITTEMREQAILSSIPWQNRNIKYIKNICIICIHTMTYGCLYTANISNVALRTFEKIWKYWTTVHRKKIIGFYTILYNSLKIKCPKFDRAMPITLFICTIRFSGPIAFQTHIFG